MFPGLNPRNMQSMMKKMGIKTEEINAIEVVIKTSDREIIIKDPEVVKTIVQNNILFQISGRIEERTAISEEKKQGALETRVESNEEVVTINEDDIKMVMSQTGRSAEESKKALVESNGNIAEAIIKLTS